MTPDLSGIIAPRRHLPDDAAPGLFERGWGMMMTLLQIIDTHAGHGGLA